MRQAQVQQPGCAFGLVHFQRVLQDQHLGTVRHRRDPAADAGAVRAQAGGAARAAGAEWSHYKKKSC